METDTDTRFTSEMRRRALTTEKINLNDRVEKIDDELDGIVQPKTGDFCAGFVFALLVVAADVCLF
jgi:hypothetical protein